MFDKDLALSFNKDPHSPHAKTLDLVPSRSVVLDVGCNIGYVGKRLTKELSCICDGVDYNDKFLAKARKVGYRNTYKLDLYNTDFSLGLCYDVLLFLDILEHLPQPQAVLKKFVRENLKKNGLVIICLPNIARLEFRVRHFLGDFSYEKSGILHQDHLRFFTKNSALAMIRSTSLNVREILPTGLGSKFGILPNLFAFQFIFVCSK